MEVVKRPVLLLDLDGVVVFETRESGAREILVLHRDLGPRLAAAAQTTIVITHRSRREAEQILRAAGLDPAHIVRLIAAEDLFRQACAGLQWRQLLRRGLQKSFALSLVERIAGCTREDVAIVDDRQHNLDAMIAAGIGLALKAPSELSGCGQFLTTFDLDAMLRSLGQWHADREVHRQRALLPVTIAVEPWRRSGLSTKALERHAFNHARRVFFAGRRLVAGSPRKAATKPL